jgi:Ca2+-binding RTX toxin-like protein
MPLLLGLCPGTVVWGALPTIQSIDVSPDPLVTGQLFTIAVTASSNVTQATATIDFRPGATRSLEIPLIKQGEVWTGSGFVPSDLSRELPAGSGATARVAVFDNAHRRTEGVVNLGVDLSSISAVFANGVLTVTGDDDDNTLVVNRDAAGTILVNGGTLAIIGGAPTTNNTTLIRIFGLGGNDTLAVDDGNGPMPPANLQGGEGDDTLTGSANVDELDGGPDNDTLLGRGGNDTLLGGPGDDLLIGGQGVDTHIGGEGDDQIVWNPGDGSDVVEGQDGDDTLIFIGANISEVMDIAPNGQRLRFTRNIGSIVMDCDGIERVIVRALGGQDQVTVNDLTGTQVSNVLVDLSSTTGTGDGAEDTVSVNGTDTNDVITVSGSATNVNVVGLSASVTVVGAEPDHDTLAVNALGGPDIVDASEVEAGAIALILRGGTANDILIGGAGDDFLDGGQGADNEFGGDGDDTFLWNPGDGNDLVEGETGNDTLLFNGANIDEIVDLSANGQRLRFSRNIGTIVMDCNEVEAVQFNAFGGADLVTVHDLTGTGVTSVNLDLAAPPTSGTGDNAADTVVVNGTTGDDVITVSGLATNVNVVGLSATVNITGTDPTLDQLIIFAQEGEDVVQASNLEAGVINLTVDGGPGNDVLIGSHGADTLMGGEGDDVLNGGPGLDVLDGGPGSNVVIQD